MVVNCGGASNSLSSLNSTTVNSDLAASSLTKKKLLLRDSLTFLSLLLLTVVLFSFTLFLFRSFTAHRAELAVRWSGRGRQALASGHPDQAIRALRTALNYAPGERSYELLLAQALGEAGMVDESFNYFTGLWDALPGDGFINLQLARLAAKKNDRTQAINFYRASIYGTWEGDGVQRRREVRVELARYLLSQGDPAGARIELLVSGGNTPDNPQHDVDLARLLAQANDPIDAADFYGRAIADEPKNITALSEAGRLAYRTGDFAAARKLLGTAVRELSSANPPAIGATSALKDLSSLLASSERLLAMAPSQYLRSPERVDRILEIRNIARKRLDACAALPEGLPASMQSVGGRWSTPVGTARRPALLGDPALQQSTLRLVYDTEREAARFCGPPSGDDALILLLAQYPSLSAAAEPAL